MELKELFEKEKKLKEEEILVVSQTTFNIKIWQESIIFLKAKVKKLDVFCSICFATIKRQEEARINSKNCNFAIVVGGKNSSNTRKLFDICNENCEAFFVENLKEFEGLDCDFRGCDVFLTAGASTPDFLIKEIFDKLHDKIFRR